MFSNQFVAHYMEMSNLDSEFLSQHDPVLAHIIATMPIPIVQSTGDVFFDLMSCTLEQQIHYRSTKRTFQRMLDMAGLDDLTPENFHQLEEKALPHFKLSTSRLETAQRILDFWHQSPLEWAALSDVEVMTRLRSIKGVGDWTVHMILLYTLERPNVFPYDDFHVKEIMISLYHLQPKSRLKAQMLEVSAHWEGHKSLAVKYLLGWKYFQKQALAKHSTKFLRVQPIDGIPNMF